MIRPAESYLGRRPFAAVPNYLGSASLFLVLAFVMWMTRNLDWYAVFKNSARVRLNPFKSGRPDKTGKPEQSRGDVA